MTSDGCTSVAPARGALGLLVDRTFGAFFWTKVLSTAGVWIYNIVAVILVFELSGSALMVGLVSVAQFGPQLLLAPVSGAMADRGDRRRQLVIGQLLVATAAGGLALWIWMAGVEGLPGSWPIIATAFFVGLGFVLVGPAQNALVPALARPNELASAIALNSLPPTIARSSGPAIGALIATTVGPAVAFAIAGVTSLTFALVMLTLDVRTHADKDGGGDSRIRAGILHAKKDRRVLKLLIGIAAVGIGVDPVVTLTPSLAAGFGTGSNSVGVLASAFGLGAGSAFIFLGTLRRRIGLPRLGPIGLLVLSLGMVGTGMSPTQTIALVTLAIAGIGMTVAFTSLTTQLQAWVPDEIRGRIMALWAMAFLGSRPVAAVVNGAVADATSLLAAFLFVALALGFGAWQCRPASIQNPV